MKDVELRIDFGAALAKLAPAQFQGTWQLPTELTRLAIASGAHSVALEIKKTRLQIRAAGAKLDLISLRDLRTLLDENGPDSERHRALVNLEERGCLALAAIGGLGGEVLELSSGGEHGWTLTARAGTRPRLERSQAQKTAAPHFELNLSGVRLDATAAEHWLRRNARFSPLAITLAGQDLERGFRRSLIRIRLREPLPASLAISERGEVPRLWLLRHGIISTRATVPGYPAFEAAVEMGAISPANATSAALREGIQPYLEDLVQAAISLIAQLARHADSLRDNARQRAARLLLESARRDRHFESLKNIRIFPQIVDSEGSRRLISMTDLEYLIRFDTQVTRLDALMPEQNPDDFAFAGRQVLVLSRFERTLLSEILHISFISPPTRMRPRRSLRQIVEQWRGHVNLGWQHLWGRLIPEDQLTAGEKTLLTGLKQATVEGLPKLVVFYSGNGHLHLTGDGHLLLPRHNPIVEASIRALERDEHWLYPVLISLLGTHDLPSPEIRNRWKNLGTDHERPPFLSA